MSGCRTVVSIANQQEGRHVNIPKKWAHLGRCCPRQSVEILSASSNLNLWNRNKAPTATDMDRKNTQSLASNRPQRSSEPDQQRRQSCACHRYRYSTPDAPPSHHQRLATRRGFHTKGFSSQLARDPSSIERARGKPSCANCRRRCGWPDGILACHLSRVERRSDRCKGKADARHCRTGVSVSGRTRGSVHGVMLYIQYAVCWRFVREAMHLLTTDLYGYRPVWIFLVAN